MYRKYEVCMSFKNAFFQKIMYIGKGIQNSLQQVLLQGSSDGDEELYYVRLQLIDLGKEY